MQTRFLLAGVLLVSAPVFAQVQPPSTTQVPAVQFPNAEPSGYDLLVQAGAQILPGPNGRPSAAEVLPDDENLKRQRLAVARNAPALALVRHALQKSVVIPLSTTYFDDASMKLGAKTRELARQFAQESDVRLADGDVSGAMNSKLDTMELGAQYQHGNLLASLVGTAIESIGRVGVREIASHLDAAQCRTAVIRLQTIQAERPSYAEILEKEQQQSQILLASILDDMKKMTPQERAAQEMTDADGIYLGALTPEKLRSDTSTYFAPLIQKAALPFQQSLALKSLPDENPLLRGKSELFIGTNPRLNYERNRTASLLLISAFELRAEKLEKGTYPASFNAPTDPFSPEGKPLIYRETATGYLLYSVGPDGKDDGGTSIQTTDTSPAGIVTVSDRVELDSLGDIIQYPF